MLRSLVKSSKRNFISLHKANARRNTSKVTGGTLADFIDAKQPWYKDGVKFNCTACGKCCTGSSGYVWINEDDIKNISTYLKISKDEFIENYTVYEGDKRRYTLKERVVATKPWEEEQIDTTYDCIFLEGTKCKIYPVRPTQCKTFPWWPDVMRNQRTYLSESYRCEGIVQEDAPVVPREVIEKNLAEMREAKSSFTMPRHKPGRK